MSTWLAHRVLVHHGATDTRKGTKRPYKTMSLDEVFQMEHQARPKGRGLAMLQSSYNAPNGRTHEVQQEHGLFVTLCLDIDKGSKSLEEVSTMVDDFTGEEVASLIYSTSSATPDRLKWRVIVPLETALPFDTWHAACEVFFDFAASRGIEVDRSLARAGQPVYLPNVPPDRRGSDGRPLLAVREVVDGRGLRMTDPGLAEWWAQRQVAPPAPAVPAANPLSTALRQAARRLLPGPIQWFNDANRVETLLERYGYTPAPRGGADWRSPLQTSDSYATQVRTGDDGQQYWISLSESDAAAGLGRATANGARTGDAFDLFVHFEHGGDRSAALSSLKATNSAAIAAAADAIVTAAERGDVGAPYEAEAITTLLALRETDPASWARLRARLRDAKVGVGELDKAMKAASDDAGEDDRSVADRLIELARRRCVLVHDKQQEAYAVFEAAGARQVHRVDANSFRDFLSHAYYIEHDRAPSDQALKVALATLRGQALFEGETREVFTRIAKTEAGYWLDLCNDAWQCVQVTATGWTVVSGEAAPLFTRSQSMRPLPVPEPGGTLDALWPLVNIPESDRLMVLAWMLECLRPDTPHVVLELVGEQGSAKSSTQRALRRLIDPNQADLRAAPKTVEDVWIGARNSHMVSLENLSHLPPQYQDALCVLATGGGYSARTLFTNAEETILELRKPIILNGIAVVVTAQDLLDRTLHIDLPTIQHREMASDMEARFEAAQPALLGALLDLFVKVLATLPCVAIAPEQRPRMADFAALGEAVFRVFGEPAGGFLGQHATMRRESVLATVDASPVGAALLAFLERTPGGYAGTLSDLLNRLEVFRPTHEAWPRSAKGLGDALRRLAPAMRLIGFECKALPKTGGVIRWHIFPGPAQAGPSPASPQSPGGRSSDLPEPTGGDREAGHGGLAGHRSDAKHPGEHTWPAYSSPLRDLPRPAWMGTPNGSANA